MQLNVLELEFSFKFGKRLLNIDSFINKYYTAWDWVIPQDR